MRTYFGRMSSPIALTMILVAGACSSKKDDTLASDTMLNRDLQMANSDTAAQPQLKDVPAASQAPAKAAPTKSGSSGSSTKKTASGNTVTKNSGTSGSAGGGAVGSIAAGTAINLGANSKVCTNTNKVGDTFTARVNEAVMGSNGAMIPAGSTVTLRITQLKRSENANDNVVVGLSVLSVVANGKTYALNADVTSAQIEKVRNEPKSKDMQKVIGGAVLGGLIGQAVGKDTKGTVIGAAAGAAAGTVAAKATANYEGCINSGDTIRIKLNQAAEVRA